MLYSLRYKETELYPYVYHTLEIKVYFQQRKWQAVILEWTFHPSFHPSNHLVISPLSFIYVFFSFYSHWIICLQHFYTPVWKTGHIMPWQCPSVLLSVCPSVRPSVCVFRTFLQHALRYQFETWYIHSVGGTTCRVWVASQLGHFDLVYSQK